MNLHPDILTDLVILYHAGEASEASRALLREEASRDTRLAAALAAPARAAVRLPVDPAPDERRVFRKVRRRYQAISFAVVWMLALLVLMLFPRLASSSEGLAILIGVLPFGVLVLFFAGVAGGLYLLARAMR